MATGQRQSFFQGAAMLAVATMIVKVIGMFYKIPLTNILGGVGFAYFMVAYNIFNPVYSLSVSGFPVAVSKLVAESAARNQYRNVKKIFRVSMVLLLLTGLLGTAVLFFGARAFSGWVENPQAWMSVAVMAPALFFCCIMASFRGYYQGLGNMAPTAASQVVESAAKLVFGIALAWMALQRGLGQYEALGTVFGQAVANREQAELAVLPYAAAAAVLGVTASTAVGAIYLVLRRMIRGDGLSRAAVKSSAAAKSSGKILGELFRLALPVCLGAVLIHITNLIDLVTISHRVAEAIQRDGDSVLFMYRGLIPGELAVSELPQYLYGAYSFTTSLYNLVPSLTTAFGVTALPLVSASWALRERERSGVQIQSVLKLSALIAIPAGLGLTALAQPVLSLLYAAKPLEAAIATPILQSMGIAAALVGITTPMSSLFQAIGRADIPVKLMAMGAVLKIVSNYLLVAVPSRNIQAAPYGTILCYGLILVVGIIWLQRCSGKAIPLGAVFFKPLFCGIICAVAAHTSYALLYRLVPSRAVCLVAVAIGGLIYLIFVCFLRILTRNEVFMLPNGKKVAKILEKLSFLG